MSETLTSAPGSTIKPPTYKGDQEDGLKELEPRQREILDFQLSEYARLGEVQLHSDLRDRLAAGDMTLPTRTLVHGTGFSLDIVESIAAHGVVSGELFGIPEDAETHYCADFFRVDGDTTLADYGQWVAESEPSTTRMRTRRMEGQYLPSVKSRGESMGIIVDPTIPEIQELLEADAYRAGTDELFEGIINHLPVDKNTPKAERLSAILVGIPRGAIAGIVVSDRLAGNSEHMSDLVRTFGASMPVLSVRGELLHQVIDEV